MERLCAECGRRLSPGYRTAGSLWFCTWECREKYCERKTATIRVRNDNPHLTVDVCVGEKEYRFKPGQECAVEVVDGDCVYLDAIQAEEEQ